VEHRSFGGGRSALRTRIVLAEPRKLRSRLRLLRLALRRRAALEASLLQSAREKQAEPNDARDHGVDSVLEDDRRRAESALIEPARGRALRSDYPRMGGRSS